MTPRRAAILHEVAVTLLHVMQILLALGDKGATFRGLASRAGVAFQHVKDWTDVLSGRVARITAPEELGLKFALIYYELRLAAVRAKLLSTPEDLRNLALDLSRSTGLLAGRVRDALRDDLIDDADLAAIEGEAYTAKASLAAVLAECARMRAARRKK